MVSAVQNSARGLWASTDSLALETVGHINSAGCEGMAMTVTAAYHSIWRHLYDSMHAAQKPKSKLKFVTIDTESNMSMLMKSRDILSPDIGPGIRTQDSVVTSSTTTSYATETVSSWRNW